MDNVKLFIALGVTGVGKSTFLNRLMGDKSRRGLGGELRNGFGVGNDVRSFTKDIAKQLINVRVDNVDYHFSIVDTPGAGDSENRDVEFENKLVLYLRGCGGVNIFGIFFSFAELRFTKPYQDLLHKYQDMLGKEFWKHCVIIATKADVVEKEEIPGLKLIFLCFCVFVSFLFVCVCV